MAYIQTSPEISNGVTVAVCEETTAGPGERGGVLAVATFGFDPEEVGAGSSTESSVDCLPLSEGDIIEVLGSGGGWLYGRHVSTRFFGYFPENRVAFPDPPLVLEDVLEDEVDVY